jgi:hypothetical protein
MRRHPLDSPAQPDRTMKRQWIAMQQLPELLKRVAELEKRFGAVALKNEPGSSTST